MTREEQAEGSRCPAQAHLPRCTGRVERKGQEGKRGGTPFALLGLVVSHEAAGALVSSLSKIKCVTHQTPLPTLEQGLALL